MALPRLSPARCDTADVAVGQARESMAPVVVDRDAPATSIPVGLVAPVAALWALVVSLLGVVVVVVIAWVLSSGDSSFSDALRGAATLWTAAHVSPVSVGAATISVLPIGLVVVPAITLVLASRWLVRAVSWPTPRAAVGQAAIMVAVYGLGAAFVASRAHGPQSSLAPGRTALHAAVLAAVCVGWTLLRLPSVRAVVLDRVSPSLSVTGRAVVLGVAGMLACASAVAGVSLGAHWSEAVGSYRVLGATGLSSVPLTIVALMYLPNAVVWTAALLVGPGFVVGGGNTVTAVSGATGALPVFPLVPALPATGAPSITAAVVLAMPVIVGALMGWFVVRARRDATVETCALQAAVAGGGCAAVLAALAALTHGGLGAGRLAQIGPSAVSVLLVGAVVLAVSAASSAWALRTLSTRRRR